jgi:DNA-binding response OmpR family regulator
MTVVVVEDNRQIADLYVELLDDLGHASRAFHYGPSFLDALPTLAPDLLIVDRRMPGLDGFDVARQVRALRPGVPILMISGTASVPTAGPGSGALIDRFLAKPCTIAQFTAVVVELLGRPGRLAAPREEARG